MRYHTNLTEIRIQHVDSAGPRGFRLSINDDRCHQTVGHTFFQLLFDEVPLRKAGGRLFFDLTYDLASPIGRKIILSTMGKGDPLMQNAILSLMKRKAFMKSLTKLEGGDAVINFIRAYLKK